MADEYLILSYFPDKAAAEEAAGQVKEWDKNTIEIKLGSIAVLSVNEKGELQSEKVGTRATGKGAKWGIALGAVAGIFTGGLTLVGGALLGLAAGAVAGAFVHSDIGMTDEDRDRLEKHLQAGGAALAVMADDFEVKPTMSIMTNFGGESTSYIVPEEVLKELEKVEIPD
jgi:uncharacterized membrane protein